VVLLACKVSGAFRNGPQAGHYHHIHVPKIKTSSKAICVATIISMPLSTVFIVLKCNILYGSLKKKL